MSLREQTPKSLTSANFDEFVERSFGQHKYNLLVDLIGKYPDLYRPDLYRIKHPGSLDKKAKKAWDTVISIMKSRYPKTSEDNIWKCWRWIRLSYFSTNCPSRIAEQISYLNDIRDSVTEQPASVAYQNLIDGTKQPKPKRIRSRIAYLSQVIKKPFVWSSVDSFIQNYGEEPLHLMINLIEQHPVLYRQDLENELMQNQLQGKVLHGWSSVYFALRKIFPRIPETTFYHAWRTLRRNFDHEQAPPYWAEKVQFVKSGGAALCTDYLEEGDDDIAGTSEFTPLKKITTLSEAMTAIEEIDAYDAVQKKKQLELKRRRANAVNNGLTGTSWSTLFGSEKAPNLRSYETGGVRGFDFDQMGDSTYEPEPKRMSSGLSTIISGAPRMPPTYKRIIVRKQGATAVPIIVRKAPPTSTETDDIVNDEIQDLLSQMKKTTEQIHVKPNDGDGIAFMGDDDYEDVKPEIPELNEIKQEECEPSVDSHASFKQIMKEKWMEFAAMPRAKKNLCLYKKEIMKVINRTFEDIGEA
ncbi:hypothetical protein QR680_019329 [Steinernema hermaphroditum]|uniref:MADF domain-containing protein n=1 Tax=Steinernema hermaphroditum TaxID=289476 RepID=A0AA39GPG4_9BILA|nr:hypothetical protein QR680_019329 [Steinernema hermaphroditum]